MQIVRTIVWVLILFAILTFSFFNWESVEVTLWDNLVLETRIPALVIIAFLLGLAPMWLYHRSVKWSLDRRIRSLENSVKSNALSKRHEPTSTSPAAASATPAVEKPGDNPALAGDTLGPAEGDDSKQ
ncbi:hypothetical protein [Erythrobacter ani]|uniref:Lipopolysaccharide assembly protein A domain-containing protein n=1 Tax=Erythrobacter ani TaxID=2827235 RepID=A0ABS6SP56_9SPHN|nr:hypothetical protein [Erythrobacter ani]MBV7266815.1 hypothetical protein [Erythrobacter ani]